MSLIVDEFLRNIFSSSKKYIFWQSRVTNFQNFPLGANHGGLNLRNLNISSLDCYRLNAGMSALYAVLMLNAGMSAYMLC